MTGPIASLTEPAGDIVFGLFLGGIAEDEVGPVVFDQSPHQKKAGKIRDARGLLHVVRDDHHGALVLEGEHQLFDFGGGDGAEADAQVKAALGKEKEFDPHDEGALNTWNMVKESEMFDSMFDAGEIFL